jgi:hypothetical protein
MLFGIQALAFVRDLLPPFQGRETDGEQWYRCSEGRLKSRPRVNQLEAVAMTGLFLNGSSQICSKFPFLFPHFPFLPLFLSVSFYFSFCWFFLFALFVLMFLPLIIHYFLVLFFNFSASYFLHTTLLRAPRMYSSFCTSFSLHRCL